MRQVSRHWSYVTGAVDSLDETARRCVNSPGPAQEADAPMHDIPYGYCRCGCGQKTNLARDTDRSKGWIKGRPLSVLRGHPFQPLPFERGGPDDCWLWRGALNNRGYGRLTRGGHVYAHRYVYELERGPIPTGMQLDHLCRTPACVNPAHLEPVTGTENVRRGRGAKLTPAAAFLIRLTRATTTLSHAKIAEMVGVSAPIVTRVLTGETWKL